MELNMAIRFCEIVIGGPFVKIKGLENFYTVVSSNLQSTVNINCTSTRTHQLLHFLQVAKNPHSIQEYSNKEFTKT